METVEIIAILAGAVAIYADFLGIYEAHKQRRFTIKYVMLVGLCALFVPALVWIKTVKDRNEATTRYEEFKAKFGEQEAMTQEVRDILLRYVAANPNERNPLIQQLLHVLEQPERERPADQKSLPPQSQSIELSLHTNLLHKALEYANAADSQLLTPAQRLDLFGLMTEQVTLYHMQLSQIQPCGFRRNDPKPATGDANRMNQGTKPTTVSTTSWGMTNTSISSGATYPVRSGIAQEPIVSSGTSNSTPRGITNNIIPIGATNNVPANGATNKGLRPPVGVKVIQVSP